MIHIYIGLVRMKQNSNEANVHKMDGFCLASEQNSSAFCVLEAPLLQHCNATDNKKSLRE